MNIDLTDTTSSRINSALVKARRASGTPAVGMVLTLVIVTDEGNHYDALKAANEASREHPARILVVIQRPGRSPRARAEARLDAEVRLGVETGTGETVLLRLYGELSAHAHSVVLPLLLPDAPVVMWWPAQAPRVPSQDLLGMLAQRRITDAAAMEDPVRALRLRAETYAPGDTDLTWTRVTPWRSVLAAALDQPHADITGAVVEGESCNQSAELLALWLAQRLRVPVRRAVSGGPGITGVRLATEQGEICLDRPDGAVAELAVPGQPDRHVALKRRPTSELIAEELRRLDPDDAYGQVMRYGAARLSEAGEAAGAAEAPAGSGTARAPEREHAPGRERGAQKAEPKPEPEPGREQQAGLGRDRKTELGQGQKQQPAPGPGSEGKPQQDQARMPGLKGPAAEGSANSGRASGQGSAKASARKGAAG